MAKELATKEDAIYVSRDEIRFSKIKKGEDYFSKEKEVYREFINRIQSAINDGKDVIADATHINRASRGKILRDLNTFDVRIIAINVDCGFGNCLARNEKRIARERVPKETMISMYKNFSKPTKLEGFDEIITIDNR